MRLETRGGVDVCFGSRATDVSAFAFVPGFVFVWVVVWKMSPACYDPVQATRS